MQELQTVQTHRTERSCTVPMAGETWGVPIHLQKYPTRHRAPACAIPLLREQLKAPRCAPHMLPDYKERREMDALSQETTACPTFLLLKQLRLPRCLPHMLTYLKQPALGPRTHGSLRTLLFLWQNTVQVHLSTILSSEASWPGEINR